MIQFLLLGNFRMASNSTNSTNSTEAAENPFSVELTTIDVNVWLFVKTIKHPVHCNSLSGADDGYECYSEVFHRNLVVRNFNSLF